VFLSFKGGAHFFAENDNDNDNAILGGSSSKKKKKKKKKKKGGIRYVGVIIVCLLVGEMTCVSLSTYINNAWVLSSRVRRR
jgi:hypothetical protein